MPATQPRPAPTVDRAPIDAVYDKYAAVSKKLSEASAVLGQAIEMIVALDREIRRCDPSNKLIMPQRLRMKVVLGAVFPVRQHIDRLITRMAALAATREAVVSDASRPDPTFE